MTDSSANPRRYGERPSYEDDPLMELSRLADFGTPADDDAEWCERHSHAHSDSHPAGSHPTDSHFRADSWSEKRRAEPDFDPAPDLERELFGGFDEPVQPSGDHAPSAERSYDKQYFRGAEPPVSEIPAATVRAPELPEPLEFEETDRSEPVPQFDYADYSSARDDAQRGHHPFPEPASAYDPTVHRPALEPYEDTWPAHPDDHGRDAQAMEADLLTEAAHPVRQAPSLEDELEDFLFRDETSAQTQAANDHWPDRARNDFADVTPSRTAYVPAPLAADQTRAEPSGYPYYTRGNFAPGAAAQVTAAHDDFALDDDFSLENEEEAAHANAETTNDDLSGLDDLDLHEDDFAIESADDLSAPQNRAEAEEFSFSEDDFRTDDDFAHGHEESEAQPAYAHAIRQDDEDRRPAASFTPHFAYRAPSAPAPEVETLNVAEEKVEQTHSLDLPEVHYAEEDSKAGLSELEAEFAEVFSTVGLEETSADSEAHSQADKAFEDIFRENAPSYMASMGAGAALGVGAAAATAAYGAQQARQPLAGGSADDLYNHWAVQGTPDQGTQVQGGQSFANEDYGAQPPEDDLGRAAEAYRNRPVRGRRGLLLASAVGAVVLLGGIGYHFIGGRESGEPVVIHADSKPIKVQPTNPGGATVPNQERAVYDSASGKTPGNPTQKSLISSGQEPVDIQNADDGNNTADAASQGQTPQGQTSQNQTAQAGSNQNGAMIKPHEVETMVVRPDGTIVQPDQSQQPSAPQTANNDMQPAAPSSDDQIGAIAGGNTSGQTVMPSASVTSTPITPTAAPQAPQQANTAEQTPRLPLHPSVIPSSRPAEQPVRIVGTVPQRTQAAAPQVASAAGAGAYYLQIASQPSAELAQRSYANMAQKYSGVIGGHAVDIKRADIAGKGTYYRVRVQAGSREDAIALCARLKSAGGSCIVTR